MASKVTFLRGLALAAGLAVLTSEVQAEVVFRGVFEITGANADCINGQYVGNINNAQFHPRGLGNENFAALTTIYSFGGNSYKLEGKNFSNSFQTVQYGGVGWSVYIDDTKVSLALDKVPDISATTNFLELTGRIKNLRGNDGQENCIVNFRAALYKHVE